MPYIQPFWDPKKGWLQDPFFFNIFSGLMLVFRAVTGDRESNLRPIPAHLLATFRSMHLKVVEYHPLLKCLGAKIPEFGKFIFPFLNVPTMFVSWKIYWLFTNAWDFGWNFCFRKGHLEFLLNLIAHTTFTSPFTRHDVHETRSNCGNSVRHDWCQIDITPYTWKYTYGCLHQLWFGCLRWSFGFYHGKSLYGVGYLVLVLGSLMVSQSEPGKALKTKLNQIQMACFFQVAFVNRICIYDILAIFIYI